MADQDTNVPNKTDFISREEMHKANRDEWEGVYGYIDCDIFEDNESMIDRVPAVDVVEVVRCKDCIHAPLPGDCKGGSNMEWPKIDGIYEDCTCPHFCDDDWYSARPDPEGFCEKGERREPNLDTTKGDSHD